MAWRMGVFCWFKANSKFFGNFPLAVPLHYFALSIFRNQFRLVNIRRCNTAHPRREMWDLFSVKSGLMFYFSHFCVVWNVASPWITIYPVSTVRYIPQIMHTGQFVLCHVLLWLATSRCTHIFRSWLIGTGRSNNTIDNTWWYHSKTKQTKPTCIFYGIY